LTSAFFSFVAASVVAVSAVIESEAAIEVVAAPELLMSMGPGEVTDCSSVLGSLVDNLTASPIPGASEEVLGLFVSSGSIVSPAN